MHLIHETARAEPSKTGVASNALAGIARVGIAETSDPTLAATFGYGLTEAQSDDDGLHHRASLRAAAGAAPLPWVGVGLTLDGRYDAHPDDSGSIVDAGLVTRLVPNLDSLKLGVELGAWAPGTEGAKNTLDALSFDARALAGYDTGSVVLGSHVGFRLDRSAAAGANAARLDRGDRLALGASDYDAILAGVGAIGRLGRTELLAEVSADVLVGSGAPPLRESPLRASAGVREPLSSRLGLEVLLSASLSSRPGIEPDDPLIPIAPRFSAFAGLRYQFAHEPAPASPSRRPRPKVKAAPKPKPEPVTLPPAESTLELALTDDLGNPLAGARVSLQIDGRAIDIPGDGSGRYRAEQLPVGKGKLSVTAERFEPAGREIELRASKPLQLEIVLEALPPPSQVRGIVRTFGGRAVAAKIRIEPLGSETTAGSDGSFQVDVPPGDYEVVIEARGFRTQRRKVRVEEEGVVILNADLVKE